MKSKRGLYNITLGILSQVIIIIIGLIIPRLFIVNLGSEANGLMSSISQIFIYVGLLEAGIGSVSIQALYKPIAKSDNEGVNKILSATAKYYRKAGIYYLICIGVLGVIYPFIIENSFSKFDIFLVIVFTGLSGAINFLFQGKYKIFLMAEGKNYIITNITTVLSVISSLIKVVLILQGFNIIVIQFCYFMVNLLQMIFFEVYIRKNYKWLDTNVSPDYKAISQKNSAFIHQISAMIFANTDIIVITLFCGLKVASVYSMYNLIVTYVSSILGNINSGIVFILGQKYHENKEEYLKLNDVYDTYYMAIAFAIYTITYILFLPFMRLYTKNIIDINYIDNLLPVLFIFIQLLNCGRMAANNSINVAGHFKKTQNRSIIEATINIVVSLVCVKMLGVYGVLMGTILALLYRVNDIILYSCKYILLRSPIKTYIRWIVNLVTMLIIVEIVNQFNIKIDSYIKLIVIGFILSVTIIPIYIYISSVLNIECFKYVKNIIDEKFKFKLLLNKKLYK